MQTLFESHRSTLATLVAAIALACAGGASAADVKVTLSGAAEVPPVQTQASGHGTISVDDDGSVSGEVMTTGITGSMAHIHQGAAGKNGGVIIPLKNAGDGKWTVPDGAKLSDAQQAAFKEGNLYVNVHSKAHPGGEIRAQLKP
ncbi:MAG TPA: CHRD domain-containing protein [Burkholderiaceae bacterium]|nr:CHRD domain-containing protein [Burkholderiaceae bacterium]